MRKLLPRLLLCLGAVLLVALTSGAQPAPDAGFPIRLQVATFSPGRGEVPPLPAELMVTGYADGQRGYYLAQFRGPIESSWKQEVEALGAELLEYVPDFAFKVRMTPAQARRVQQLASVGWIGLFHPGYKLSPKLIRDGARLYTVRIERGADALAAANEIARVAGAEVVSRSGDVLTILVDSARLNAIARVADVAWIENFLFRKKQNEYGAGVILGANTANANGYDGSSQIVGIADTGLGGGTTSTAHVDLPGSRIVTLNNWPGASSSCYNVIDDGAKDVDSGHGTHVAVSALGDGGTNGEGKGTAPAARLFFQAVENWADMKGLCALLYLDGYYLLGIPSDIRQVFQQAYDGGARIHSDSWGSEANGDYTADSANADSFVWSKRDMVILFAAGNSGTDANGDGIIDSGSLISPATAKNVIAVGASENDRQGHYECDSALSYTNCASQGGQNYVFTYGEAWPFDYPAFPLSSDPSAGNKEQMAAFSSRGPAADGRIKPDVVAPGTWVLSGYSGLYQQGYDGSPNPQNSAWQYDGWGYPLSALYKYMGGTSMSTPLAAGAAAVVRDYYQKAKGHSASAALIKATLINSAVDMSDENNDGINDNAFPIPNVHEGWGRINLANATDGSYDFVDNTSGLSTNGSATYQYSVTTSGAPFKVTLVWSDYSSTETAAKNLVNDLDLLVTSPGGTTYRGNVFSGGWSAASGSADRANNVENVYMQAAMSGTWTVQVLGYNVPNGPQPFAMVVDGGTPSGGPVNSPPTASFTYACSGLSCSFDASGSSDSDGTIASYSWDFGDGSTGTGVTTSHTYAAAGTYNVTLTVTDNAGATGTQTQAVTVSQPPATQFLHIGDLDGATQTVRKNWKATVTITVHDANHVPVANATVSGTWSGGYSGSASCTTNGSGQCSLTTGNVSAKKLTVTFTVNNVTHATLSYAATANHDPDGDSDGTSITVNKP